MSIINSHCSNSSSILFCHHFYPHFFLVMLVTLHVTETLLPSNLCIYFSEKCPLGTQKLNYNCHMTVIKIIQDK